MLWNVNKEVGRAGNGWLKRSKRFLLAVFEHAVAHSEEQRMKKAPFTMFGKTLDVKLITYTDGKVDAEPKEDWVDTLWVERGEDYYALSHYRGKTVRVVQRSDWLAARDRAESK